MNRVRAKQNQQNILYKIHEHFYSFFPSDIRCQYCVGFYFLFSYNIACSCKSKDDDGEK